MAKALGVGVRVYIAWVPKSLCQEGAPASLICTTGMIVDGPFAPFTLKFWDRGEWQTNTHTMWEVRPDADADADKSRIYAEKVLTPIDDDGSKVEPREAELEQC